MKTETQWKARLWLELVFLLGGAIGAVFGHNFAHRSYAAGKAIPAALSEPERRAKRIAKLTGELGLTPEQSAKVNTIISGAHEEMKTIHEKSDADVDLVRQRARGEIRELLTADQKPKFEVMIQRMDEERKKQQEAAGK